MYSYCNNTYFTDVTDRELFIINGGNNIAVAGGIVAIGVCVVGCGVAAVIGFAVGGPVGAAAAAYSCAKATAPVWIGGAVAIIGGLIV